MLLPSIWLFLFIHHCSGAVLTCPQFAHQHPWILTHGAALQLLGLQPVPVCRWFLPMCKAFPELWGISASSFLQSVKDLLQLPLAILEDAYDVCQHPWMHPSCSCILWYRLVQSLIWCSSTTGSASLPLALATAQGRGALICVYIHTHPIHTQEPKDTHTHNLLPWHPCLLVPLQMDHVHTKAHTWELEESSPKWIEVIPDLWLGYCSINRFAILFWCLLDVTAWPDPEVKALLRKVKWWLVVSQLSSRRTQRKVGQRATNYQESWV